MSSIASQLDELLSKVNGAWELLKLDDVADQIKEIEVMMGQQDFWI